MIYVCTFFFKVYCQQCYRHQNKNRGYCIYTYTSLAYVCVCEIDYGEAMGEVRGWILIAWSQSLTYKTRCGMNEAMRRRTRRKNSKRLEIVHVLYINLFILICILSHPSYLLSAATAWWIYSLTKMKGEGERKKTVLGKEQQQNNS